MGLSKEVDISRALDTAETRGVSGDPIMRKLRTALQDGKEKCDGSKKKAVQVLATPTRIGECLAEVSPIYGAAWNGRMKCTTGMDQADQEHDAMVETAHRLYETFSQSGAPALAMMRSILQKMLPMDFIVTREAAEFAAEAYIHHLYVHGGQLDQDMLLRRSGVRLVHQLGPRKVHRMEGGADKPGCREGAELIQNAGSRCARRKIPTTS
jgi:hypothetical protein